MTVNTEELIQFLVERSPYILLKHCNPENSNTELFSAYQLLRLLIFCGIKVHKVELVLNELLRRLLYLYLDPPDAKSDVKASNTVLLKCYEYQSCLAEQFFEVELDHLVRGVGDYASSSSTNLREIYVDPSLLLEQYHSASSPLTPPPNALENSTVSSHSDGPVREAISVKYVLQILYEDTTVNVLDSTIASLLSQHLSGILVTVQPSLRWESSLSVLRSSFIIHHPIHQKNVRLTNHHGNKDIPLVVFIGGTSGSGKSTLTSALATQLGIQNVLSTDHVRQMLRWKAKLPKQENSDHTSEENSKDYPKELFFSTYEAFHADPSFTDGGAGPSELGVIAAYQRQSNCVVEELRNVILETVIRKRQSIIVEGAHLLPSFTTELHESLLSTHNVACVNTLVYIKNGEKHKERFFVRAKSMSLKPSANKYVQSFDYIRAIQAYLVQEATVREKNVDPIGSRRIYLLKNSNVDKTISQIHYLVLRTLERMLRGDKKRQGKDGGLPETWLLSSKKALAQLLLRKREKEKDSQRQTEKGKVRGAAKYDFGRARSIDDFTHRFDQNLLSFQDGNNKKDDDRSDKRDNNRIRKKVIRSTTVDQYLYHAHKRNIDEEGHNSVDEESDAALGGDEDEVGSLTSEPR